LVIRTKRHCRFTLKFAIIFFPIILSISNNKIKTYEFFAEMLQLLSERVELEAWKTFSYANLSMSHVIFLHICQTMLLSWATHHFPAYKHKYLDRYPGTFTGPLPGHLHGPLSPTREHTQENTWIKWYCIIVFYRKSNEFSKLKIK
jgi:hypothetical protein